MPSVLRVCGISGWTTLAILAATPADAGHPLTTTVATDFTPQALLLSGATSPGDIPPRFRRAVPRRGLRLDSTRRPTRIFGASIGAKLLGPAYSSPPAAWFFGANTTGKIVAGRPAVRVSFRLFVVGDGNLSTTASVNVRFLLGNRVVSSTTVTGDRVVKNLQTAQVVTFASKVPFTKVVISTNDAVSTATIDDLAIQTVGR